jgi:hypothetical protein
VLASSCNTRVVFFDIGEGQVKEGREVECGDGVNQILWLTDDILAVLLVGDGLILFSYSLFETIERVLWMVNNRRMYRAWISCFMITLIFPD